LATAFVNVAADGSALNAHLRADSPLIGAADAALQAADDFDRRPRGGSNDTGAYVFIAGDDDDDDGGPPSSGVQVPGAGGVGATPGPAKSEEGCAAAPRAWPFALAVAFRRRRKA
jgi:hypothetical protein